MRNITYYLFIGLLFTLLYCPSAQGQTTYQWATQAGGIGADQVNDVAVDRFGNIHAIGQFESSITLGTTTLNSAGITDMFITKLDSNGAVIWAKKAGGDQGDFGNGITVDLSGNVYITGYVSTFAGQNPADFDGVSVNGAGDLNIIVAKYNSSGTIQWVKDFGAQGNIFVNEGIAIDADVNGYTYVTGTFTTVLNIGSTTLNSPFSESLFIMKLDPAGNPVWVKSAGDDNTGSERGLDIEYDGGNGLYLAGQFGDSTTFGATLLVPAGSSDAFFLKMDTSGTFVYATPAGGPGFNRALGISADGNGEAYVSGSFVGSLSAGSFTLSSNVNKAIFFGKLSATGVPVWLKSPTSLGISGNSEGTAVIADPSGDGAVFTGFFQDTLQLGPNVFFAPQGATAGFLARYNSSGNSVLWSKKSGSKIQGIDALGANIVVGGSFFGTENFDATSLTSADNADDGFIGYLIQSLVGFEELFARKKLEMFPNPASEQVHLRFDLKNSTRLSISILDMQGRTVKSLQNQLFLSGNHEQILDVSELQNGIYLLEISSGEARTIVKLSVVD